MDDLIERLRAVKWEPTDDAERMPDDPTLECVHVDMRPADFLALLREAADALVAAREDAERLAEALKEAEGYIDPSAPSWYGPGQRMLKKIRAALRYHDQEGKNG